MSVIWNPAALNASIQTSFRQTAGATAVAIEATKPSSKITVAAPRFIGGNQAIIKAGGLAPIFEKGAKPHMIFPKGAQAFRASKSKGQTVFKLRAIRGHTTQVLSFAPGEAAASAFHPGMKAQPFLAPQAVLFRPRFNQIARLNLARTGFGLKAA